MIPGQATTARTQLVCLLGHPVAHSASPEIHSAAFAAAGIDAAYLAFDVLPEELPAALEGLRACRFLGANITVPHKRAVWEACEERTPEAEVIGAANTLYWEGATLVADNTDAAGLLAVLEQDVALRRGEQVVLFGAGGVARAAAVALGRIGAGVRVVARREEAAAEIGRLAEQSGATVLGTDARPRVVINATPLGLHDEPLPAPFMDLVPGQVALDLVYRPEPTPFLAAARDGGADAIDGLAMLVGQAARSFQRWTGQPAPVSAMRAAAYTALER